MGDVWFQGVYRSFQAVGSVGADGLLVLKRGHLSLYLPELPLSKRRAAALGFAGKIRGYLKGQNGKEAQANEDGQNVGAE